MPKHPSGPSLGAQAEQLAETYLAQRGLTLVARNFRCKLGEIDLIMRDRDTLVFVEVRSRRSNAFGTALESVSHTKQLKLRRSAEFYAQQRGLNHQHAMRFDVVGIETANTPVIDWVQNAF